MNRLCLTLAALSIVACSKQHHDHDHEQPEATAEAQKAPEAEALPTPTAGAEPAAASKLTFADVEPLFERYCFKCHGAKGKKKARKHVDMTKRPFGGHHKAGLPAIAKVLVRGKNGLPKMPEGPGRKLITDAEIASIVQWVEDGAGF